MTSLDDFHSGGPKAFPPACLRTHWDPTMVVAHVLPDFHIATAGQTYDPRSAVRDCFFYYTGAPVFSHGGPAPHPAEPSQGLPPTPPQFLGGPHRPKSSVGSGVFPPGGAASISFPFSGFKPAVETDLLRVDEPATKCAQKRYIPPNGMPLPSVSGNEVPGSLPPRAPVAPYSECRREDDAAAWERSNRLFFNPTRYDRTTMAPSVRPRAERLEAPPPKTAVGVPSVRPRAEPRLYRPPSLGAVREPPLN